MHCLPLILRRMPLLFCLMISSVSWASNPPPESSQAPQFLSLSQEGKYNEAVQALEAAHAGHQVDDGNYYYNLGTLNLRLGRAGNAVAYLEKASRIIPGNSDIEANLIQARASLARLIGGAELDPGSSWLERLADRFPLEGLAAAVAFALFCLSLFGVRRYLRGQPARQLLLQPAGLLGILCIAVLGLTTLAQSFMRSAAVCVADDIIRSGPGETYLELSRASAGIRLRLAGPTSTSTPSPSASPSPGTAPGGIELWYQVRYSGDSVGWIRSSSLLLL